MAEISPGHCPLIRDVLTAPADAVTVCSTVHFAKIKIESDEHCAKALHGMMQRGRVTLLRDHVFIVPVPALEWLQSEQVPFTLLTDLHQDDVVQALRDNLADPVQ
jgi:hypothetical protein